MGIRADEARVRRHLLRSSAEALGLGATPGRIAAIVTGATIAVIALAVAALAGLLASHGG